MLFLSIHLCKFLKHNQGCRISLPAAKAGGADPYQAGAHIFYQLQQDHRYQSKHSQNYLFWNYDANIIQHSLGITVSPGFSVLQRNADILSSYILTLITYIFTHILKQWKLFFLSNVFKCLWVNVSVAEMPKGCGWKKIKLIWYLWRCTCSHQPDFLMCVTCVTHTQRTDDCTVVTILILKPYFLNATGLLHQLFAWPPLSTSACRWKSFLPPYSNAGGT